MQNHELRLATRRSLLAMAQSRWVARELERRHPFLKVTLVGIDTRGDKILDQPLNQIAGKEFFVAELDAALKDGSADFTVHSLKDLSLDRPPEFTLAAIPRRENPRDVALFGPHILERLAKGHTIKIGTSSPRRLENLPGFLTRSLPWLHADGPQVEFVEIRGNVNTRIERLHEQASHDRHLDGVILAFAGLIRLWQDAEAQTQLKQILKNIRWMILPLAQCPAAPAQGALAVECRKDRPELIGWLNALTDPAAERAVRSERAVLQEYGGGCHQMFGATEIQPGGLLAPILFIRGKTLEGQNLRERRWQTPSPPSGPIRPWDSMHWRIPNADSQIAPNSAGLKNQASVFVTHARAWPEYLKTTPDQRVWTSGAKSWETLARRGIWVEGCSEGWGFESLHSTLNEPVLQLPPIQDWTIFTHESGTEAWKRMGVSSTQLLTTYSIPNQAHPDAIAALGQATFCYWGSGSQFERYKNYLPPVANHACGPGKTAQVLQKAGVAPLTIFPGFEEWKNWLGINDEDESQ